MSEHFRRALIAGLVAAVIWMVVIVLVDMDRMAIVGGGIAFLVGTTLSTLGISTVLQACRGRTGHLGVFRTWLALEVRAHSTPVTPR